MSFIYRLTSRRLRKYFLITVLLSGIFIILLISLGRFLDVTQKPVNADIIVSLGGIMDSSDFRLKRALKLYKNGFSRSGKIIFTGGIKKYYYKVWGIYLENNGIPKQDVIYIDQSIAYNTMEEVLFIKQYMLKHHMKSVIFVSHPQHSRRITILANSIAGYKEAGLNLMVASVESRQWRREESYKGIISIKSTISEIVKLFYNLIKYSDPLIQYTQYSKKVQNNEWEKALERLD
jgi:hypothetical protein